MSRTYRKRPGGYKLHRSPRTRSSFKGFYIALEKLREAGFEPPNRMKAFGNPGGPLNPLKYSHKPCAAITELPKLKLNGEPVYGD